MLGTEKKIDELSSYIVNNDHLWLILICTSHFWSTAVADNDNASPMIIILVPNACTSVADFVYLCRYPVLNLQLYIQPFVSSATEVCGYRSMAPCRVGSHVGYPNILRGSLTNPTLQTIILFVWGRNLTRFSTAIWSIIRHLCCRCHKQFLLYKMLIKWCQLSVHTLYRRAVVRWCRWTLCF